jgi:dienelactone hydrolase
MHISDRVRAAVTLAVLSLVLAACGSDPPQAQPKKHAQAPLPPAGEGGPAGARAVGFRAGDGVGLRGRLFGHGRAAVVLAHMGNRPDNESDWYPFARRLAREGYLVLTYNRRAVCTGEEKPYDCSAGINDFGTSWQDVIGAVKFIESQGADHVALAGSSIGGTAVVYAAQTGRIYPTALISLAGVNHISTYSMDRDDIRRIGGAKLFVSARHDPDGAEDSARELSGWARAPKRLVLLDSDLHGTDMLDRRQRTAKPLTDLMVRFLRASMPPSA